MRRPILIFVTLLFCGLAFGKTESLRLQDLTFSLDVPSGWSSKAIEDGYEFTNPRAGTITAQLSLKPYDGTGSGKQAAKAYVDEVGRTVAGKQKGMTEKKTFEHRFAGQPGYAYTLDGQIQGVAMTIWVVGAVSGGQVLTFWAVGKADEFQTYRKDILQLLNTLKVHKRGSKSAPTPRAKSAKPRTPKVPDWSKEKPFPKPKAGAPLVDDTLLGVFVDNLPEWGVLVTPSGYELEKRVGATRRVRAVVSLSSKQFKGNGPEYAGLVAKGEKANWAWFAQRTAFWRTSSSEGEEVYEFHLLRAGRPLIVKIHAEGLKQSDYDAKVARGELASVLGVKSEGIVKRTRSIQLAGLIDVPIPRKFRVASYGPGPSARLAGPKGLSIDAQVHTKQGRGRVPTCPNGKAASGPSKAGVAGTTAADFRCGDDGMRIVVIEKSGYLVELRMTDPKEGGAGRAANKFLDRVNF